MNCFQIEKINFSKNFLHKNCKCGFYTEVDVLKKNLNFREDTLEGYFRVEANKISSIRKLVTSLFKKPIKWYLLKQSEPLEACQKNDEKLKQRLFK